MMEAKELKSKYVDAITSKLRQYQETNYPESTNVFNDKFVNNSPKSQEINAFDSTPLTTLVNGGMNAMEARESRLNSTGERSSAPINLQVADGLNYAIDKFGDVIGQDFSGIGNRFQYNQRLPR